MQLVAGVVAERVVDALEVVQIDEQRGDRRLLAACAHEHLLGAIEHQRAVRQPRQRVVGGHEGELLLASLELLVGSLALVLKALAYANERDIEAQLQHRKRLRQRLR